MLFVPRQVALASSSSSSNPPAAAAAAAAMAKEESKKEKKRSKSKAAAAAPAPASDARAVVVASIAAFLEAGGFPRALAALQSESNLEAGAWRSSAVCLEDLVSKFLESSAAPATVTVGSNEQDKTTETLADDASKKKKGGDIELNETGKDVAAPSTVQEADSGEKKKKKKKKKKASEPETEALEPSTEDKPAENDGAETKEKKHKKKKNKDGSSAGEAKETVKSDDQKVEGKKKKSKKQDEDDDVEARLEKVSLAIENKFEAAEKKEKSANVASEKIDAGTAVAEADGANGKSDAAESVKDDNDKKAKKKRKKSVSEENIPSPDDENKSGMEIEEGENGKPSGENAAAGKKRKLEDFEGRNPPATENGMGNHTLSNGFAKDDSKPSKKQKKSTEPKSVTPFQRVKLEAVKFADERLQDNSYWAKGGAEIGYGAKAQEVLGQVKGRGFRHEKTKKKRGTYRGGQIDLGTHSIKFDNSDDE